MVKRQKRAKRSALDASLSDITSLASGEQPLQTQTNALVSDDCMEWQDVRRCTISNTPRVVDHMSSTRMWCKLSDKMDKQHELMRELNDSTRNQIRECEEKILCTFERKIKTIETEISCLRDKLSALESVAVDINKQREELNGALSKIHCLESKSNEIGHLQNEIKTLNFKLQRHENNTVASDLRINGIPYMENENLIGIFNDICKTINTNSPAIKNIYRLNNHNNKRTNDSPDAVILVRMWCPYDKNYFLKTLANFKKLNKGFNFCLNHIGLNSTKIFFINENLTQTNYQILQAAISLKRDKQIHSAFTMRGFVYIKEKPEDKPFRVEERAQLSDLNYLFRANQTFTNQGDVSQQYF